jgi:putative acetyltransferase
MGTSMPGRRSPDQTAEADPYTAAVPWSIEIDDLSDPAVVGLLEAHVAQLRATSPPESTHALDLDGLRREAVTLWVARDDDGSPVGCLALSLVDPTHPELKSMRTDSAATGRGIGTAVLQHVLAHARADGLDRLWLETGAEDFFAPARRLYARHGFTRLPERDWSPVPDVHLIAFGTTLGGTA